MQSTKEIHKFVVKEGTRGAYIAIEPMGGKSRKLAIYPPLDTPYEKVAEIAHQLNAWDLALDFQ
jgi:hypothetical protein